MKSCPTCNRTFEDTFTFCLVDGSILSAPYDPHKTLHLPDSNVSDPPPTEILYPTIRATDPIPSLPTEPTLAPVVERDERTNASRRKNQIIIGVAAVLIFLVGVLVAASWSRWFGNNNSQAKQSNPENTNSGTKIETTTGPISAPPSNPTAGPAPQGTPSPKPTPTLAKKVDVTGNWTGMFAGRPAVLFINNQEGQSFSGILKNSKGAIVAVSGRVDPETRQISIQENRIIEHVKEGPDWVLGSNSGTVSGDANRMAGTGRDSAGHKYAWSFSK